MYFKPLDKISDEYRRWAQETDRIGIGYPILDDRTGGGAAAGEVILFQARSSVGKTTFALNVVNNNPDAACLFFSLEMHGRYLIPRLAAMHTGTNTAEIERALKAGEQSHPALKRTLTAFPNLAIVDLPAMSLKQMGEAMAEVRGHFGRRIELVVIDYLELIGGTMSLSTLDRIDKLTQQLKNFAREHDTVVLLLHQVGRNEGGAGAKALSLTSARYGGEVAADYVIGAYKPSLREGISQDQYLTERWWFYLQFLKTRGGHEIHPQGVLHWWHPETMRITADRPDYTNQVELEGVA